MLILVWFVVCILFYFVQLLLENSVAVSEHINHQKELDCQLHKIAAAEEKLQVLKDYEIPKGEL